MIFVQPLRDNFLSHTHIILLFSLFLFLSPLFLINEKREKRSYHISCLKWLFKYQYSKMISRHPNNISQRNKNHPNNIK